MTSLTARDLEGRLLAFLRERLQNPKLSYADPLEHIPGGANVHVYGFRLRPTPDGFERGLVVRVWRAADSEGAAAFESCLQNALADLDYPVPKVLAWSDDPAWVGVPFQVMQRVSGSALLRVGNNVSDDGRGGSFMAAVVPDLGRLLFRDWPGTLARLQARLHDLPVEPVLRALHLAGFDLARVGIAARIDRLQTAIDECGLGGLSVAVRWLREHAPSPGMRLAVCHGDFFANQVFTHDGGFAVLDWGDAMIAPAEVDVGIVKCGLETAPVPLPGPLRRAALEAQRWMARRFLSAYRQRRSIDQPSIGFGEAFRATQTLVEVLVRRLMVKGAIPGTPGPHPYDSDLGIELLRQHLSATASIEVRFR
jgi:aminoglycoside phosphotransferase (APT) family kinase protein